MSFKVFSLLICSIVVLSYTSCKDNSVDTQQAQNKITKITNLSNTGVYKAKLTPNKSKVIYSFSENYGSNYEIRFCDINGNNDKEIIKMDNIQYFAISKDENKFAFSNTSSISRGAIF
ncbi:MAG: hypothetical protein P8X47_11030, partial [Ignavibacteriaceae bacterium]